MEEECNDGPDHRGGPPGASLTPDSASASSSLCRVRFLEGDDGDTVAGISPLTLPATSSDGCGCSGDDAIVIAARRSDSVDVAEAVEDGAPGEIMGGHA